MRQIRRVEIDSTQYLVPIRIDGSASRKFDAFAAIFTSFRPAFPS